jgi:hypothetical protein
LTFYNIDNLTGRRFITSTIWWVGSLAVGTLTVDTLELCTLGFGTVTYHRKFVDYGLFIDSSDCEMSEGFHRAASVQLVGRLLVGQRKVAFCPFVTKIVCHKNDVD